MMRFGPFESGEPTQMPEILRRVETVERTEPNDLASVSAKEIADPGRRSAEKTKNVRTTATNYRAGPRPSTKPPQIPSAFTLLQNS